jgi:DNA-3-methyladenine glycosylase II
MWQAADTFLSQDRYLGLWVKKYGPCKLKPRLKKDYFADLVDAIVSQQLSNKAASTIFNRLKEKCGGKITPEKLKKLKTEEMRKCGLSYAKCAYAQDLAERIINNKLKIRDLDKLPDEEVLAELIAVKGIGRWTAEMFLMFTLARPDIFPVDDLGIRKGMQKLVKRPMDKKALTSFAEKHWQPFRTVAAWYIWRGLDNQA